jgi:hypothetical protein
MLNLIHLSFGLILGVITQLDAQAQSLGQPLTLLQANAARLLTEPLQSSSGPDHKLVRDRFTPEAPGLLMTVSKQEAQRAETQASTIMDALGRTSSLTNAKDGSHRIGSKIFGKMPSQTIGANVMLSFQGAITWLSVNSDLGDALTPELKPYWQDAQGFFGVNPKVIASLAGGAGEIYEVAVGSVMILLPEETTLFKSISTERAIRAQLAAMAKYLGASTSLSADSAKEMEAFLKPEAVEARRKKREADYDAAVAKGTHEKSLAQMRRLHEGADAVIISKIRGAIVPSQEQQDYASATTLLRSQLDIMDAPNRASPACVREEPRIAVGAQWRFGKLGEPGCNALVEINPALLEVRPTERAKARWLTIRLNHCMARDFKKISEHHPDEIICRKRIDMLRETDWVSLRRTLFTK